MFIKVKKIKNFDCIITDVVLNMLINQSSCIQFYDNTNNQRCCRIKTKFKKNEKSEE